MSNSMRLKMLTKLEMQKQNRALRGAGWIGGLGALSLLLLAAAPANAGDEFERSFKYEFGGTLGRLAAYEAVGVGRSVLGDILGVHGHRHGHYGARYHYPRRSGYTHYGAYHDYDRGHRDYRHYDRGHHKGYYKHRKHKRYYGGFYRGYGRDYGRHGSRYGFRSHRGCD